MRWTNRRRLSLWGSLWAPHAQADYFSLHPLTILCDVLCDIF